MTDPQPSVSESHPRVLISYSHDSPEHARAVLELSNRLRSDGIDCTIDQYLMVPGEGWPRWMDRQIRDSDFVVMVCSATYYRRVMGDEEAGKGRGVRWEGHLIYQYIYEAGTINTKFIPVLFEGGDAAYIPAPLRSAPFYWIQTEAGYEDLYCRLLNQPRTTRAELGKLRSMPQCEQKSEGAVGRLHNVPDLPPHFLAREESLTPLKEALLSDRESPVGVTGTLKAVGVQGMGGIGKTVMASAMAHDPEVRRAFPDGIYWVTVGREPNLVGLQMELAENLTGAKQTFTTVAKGKDVVRHVLEGRRALIVLDDVWQLDHGDALVVGVPPSRSLITTRNAEVLVGLGAREHRLDVLSPADALAMLADWAGVQLLEKLPREAPAIAKECGYLPLALAMIGAMLRLQPTGWADALASLQCADLEEIKRSFAGYPYPDLFKAIDVSVEGLEPADRERYLDLAVFPEDQAIPDTALQVLWRLDGRKTRSCMGRLTARSLASAISETGTVVAIRLHDLQGDLVRKRREAELPRLHQRLVDSWGDLVKLPDAYAWRRVTYHLIHAGRKADLRRLLLDLRWMRAKLKATDLSELIVEYDWMADDEDLGLVQGALRLAQVLWQDPAQMPGQLLARLSGKSPGMAAVCESIANWEEETWLQPLRPLLTPPGTALLLTLAGH